MLLVSKKSKMYRFLCLPYRSYQVFIMFPPSSVGINNYSLVFSCSFFVSYSVIINNSKHHNTGVASLISYWYLFFSLLSHFRTPVSPVWGTQYLEFDWFVPRMGLQS